MAKAICISGGGSAIAWLLGKLCAIKETIEPKNMVTGISSGAILAMVHHRLDIARDIILKLNNKKVWKYYPLSVSGMIYALLKNKSVGKLKIESLINKHYTEDIHNSHTVPVYIGVVNESKGKYEIHDITIMNRDKAIKYVVASATPGILSDPVKIDSDYYSDGGYITHCEVEEPIRQGLEVHAIFSSPSAFYNTYSATLKNRLKMMFEMPLWDVSQEDKRKVINNNGYIYEPDKKLVKDFWDFNIDHNLKYNSGYNK